MWKWVNPGYDYLFDDNNSQYLAAGRSNTDVSFWMYGHTISKNIPANTKHIWAHMSEYTDGPPDYCSLRFSTDNKNGVRIDGLKMYPIIDGVEQTAIDFTHNGRTTYSLNIEVKSSADSGLLNIWFDGKLMYTYSGVINAGADLNQVQLYMDASISGRPWASDFIFSDEALDISERIISAPVKDTTTTGASIGDDGIYNYYNSGNSVLQTIDTDALIKTVGDNAVVTTVILAGEPAYRFDTEQAVKMVVDGTPGDSIDLGTNTSGRIIASQDVNFGTSEIAGKKIGWQVV